MTDRADLERRVDELAAQHSGQAFAEAIKALAGEAEESPELLKDAPTSRSVRRLDEVKAAKRAIVTYGFDEHPDLSGEESVGRQLEAQKGA